MYYTVSHTTRFRYSLPVTESVMEVRMQPRTEGAQRCLHFELETQPAATVLQYTDYRGNIVHHFDILPAHRRLEIVARAVVEIGTEANVALPEALEAEAWRALDVQRRSGDAWDYLHESHFVRFTPRLQAFAQQVVAQRQADPLTQLLALNQAIYTGFDYMPATTTVDSQIDELLAEGRGVCQDFTHLMVAVCRWWGIPARYVSGYLHHRNDDHDRSAADATHAWMEAWLPGLEWVGFDPTNALPAGERHIRGAIGRDYADVSPARGVFKGEAASELAVAVAVSAGTALPASAPPVTTSEWAARANADAAAQMQQMQQQ